MGQRELRTRTLEAHVDGGGPTSYFSVAMSSGSATGGLTTRSKERERQTDAPLRPGRCNVLLVSFLSFVLIVFGLWVVSAGKRYREEYSEGSEGWRVGSSRVVELTLVKEDAAISRVLLTR